jgi:hypothetical protein
MRNTSKSPASLILQGINSLDHWLSWTVVMKYKSFALLAASFTMVASGQETKEAPAEAAKEDVSKEVVAYKVAASIAPVVQKFEGEKYVPTKLTGNPDYYIMYFTASW